MGARLRSCLRVLFVVGLALLGLGLSPLRAGAQPIDREAIPAELRPWIPWVLDDLGEAACPALGDARVCVWPGRLALKADATGATFRYEVVTERRMAIALPGNANRWPEAVKIGAAVATVLSIDDVPSVQVAAGSHVIEGRFAWRELPEVLVVPLDVARVSLEVDGKAVSPVRRDGLGQVWLRAEEAGGDEPAEPSTEPSKTQVTVARHIQDGVPVVVTTQVTLRTSGGAREIELGQPLLEGGELLSLDTSGLAVRFGPGGGLVVSAHPGDHVLTITERHPGGVASLKSVKRAPPWPADEVWAWQPTPTLRQVDVSGASPVDPSVTALPAAWAELSTFKVRPGDVLALETISRGDAEPPPNRLSLQRRVWLDLDGDGFTAVDVLSGDMHRGFRLGFTAPGQLGKVSEQDGDRLITVLDGEPGVELRRGSVAVAAEWRGARASESLPAIGWDTPVESVVLEVMLPPGWQLVHASGADDFGPTPFDDWELLDLVWLIAVAGLVGALLRWPWGVGAAVGLFLAQPSGVEARWVWVLLASLCLALSRLPEGRVRAAARAGFWVAGAAFVALLAIHVVEGLTGAAYPEYAAAKIRELEMEARETEQLVEASADNKEGGTGTRAKGEEGSMGAPSRADALRDAAEFGMIGLLNSGAGGDPWGKDDATKKAAATDPNEVVQTGEGVPRWSGTTATLIWGRLAQDAPVRLWLLTPVERGLLTLLGLALSVWVAVALLRLGRREVARRPPGEATGATARPSAATAAAALLVGGWLSTLSGHASAEAPPAELLTELKERLTRPAACEPSCVSVSSLRVEVSPRALTIVADVHAGALAAYALPGPPDAWAPSTVEVDGQAARALALVGEGLHLRLEPGAHEVRLRGSLARKDTTLALGTAPRRVTVAADGWTVSGVDEDGYASGSIQLVPSVDEAAAPPEGEPESEPEEAPPAPVESESGPPIAPWLEVHRTLEAGVTWKVHTIVQRVSAPGRPVSVRIPLLEGENVTDGGFVEEGNDLVLQLAANDKTARWSSSMEPRDVVALVSPMDRPWSERWTLRCSSLWRCAAKGIAPSSHQRDGVWAPTYLPWAGEKIEVALQRPPAAAGRSLTVRSAELSLEPGERSVNATLRMDVSTSIGGVHELTIPAAARITRLTLEGRDQPASLRDGGVLPVTLRAGRFQLELAWEEAGGLSAWYRAPVVRVGDQAANATVAIQVPRDRWLVATGGEGWGTSLLFWWWLALLAIAGAILGRLPHSPLPSHKLAIITAGFVTMPPLAGVVVVGWLFASSYRRGWTPPSRVLSRLSQIGLGLWTVIALGLLALIAYLHVSQLPGMELLHQAPFADRPTFYADRTDGALLTPWVLSVSPWVWRGLAVAWALAVALWMVRWVKVAWADAPGPEESAAPAEKITDGGKPPVDPAADGGEIGAEREEDPTDATTSVAADEAPDEADAAGSAAEGAESERPLPSTGPEAPAGDEDEAK